MSTADLTSTDWRKQNSVAQSTAAAESSLKVTVARSVMEIEALRAAWMEWPGNRDSDIDFYLMILRTYPEVLQPYVVAVYRNGQPSAILIGRLEKRRVAFKFGYFGGLRPLARCITFGYYPLRGEDSPENIRLLLTEVVRSLDRGEADLATLEWIPVSTPLYEAALTIPGFWRRDIHPPEQGHAKLKLPKSIDDVYGRMSGRRRKGIRGDIRRLKERAGPELQVKEYRHGHELDTLFRDAEAVAQRTYLRGLQTGFSDTPLVRERLSLCAEKGWLRAYVAYVGARPFAFWIASLYGPTFGGEFIGYDPEWREFSPGMFLMLHVIEGLCRRDDGDLAEEVDWGGGHAEYKKALSDSEWQEARIYIFGMTPKGILLKSFRGLTVSVERLLRRILESTNLLPKVKKFWRERLRARASKSGGDVRATP